MRLSFTAEPLRTYITQYVACRTGVIFCVFKTKSGESEASAKRELRAMNDASVPAERTRETGTIQPSFPR